YTQPTPPRALPAFPTRRSSDLNIRAMCHTAHARLVAREDQVGDVDRAVLHLDGDTEIALIAANISSRPAGNASFLACIFQSLSRSEEHTSELQSRVDLVCRLLL